jgi:hypothetical protein
MKTLKGYVVADKLYVADTGVEAKVGDQVKLFLDQEAIPGFPEFIFGIIQHPIATVNCGESTSYSIEYDEADLEGAALFLRPVDVVDATISSDFDRFNIQTFADEGAAMSGGLIAGDVYFNGTNLRVVID